MDQAATFAKAIAERHRKCERFTLEAPAGREGDLDFAYATQAALLPRIAGGSPRIAGWKVGLTTPRMQQMCGIDQPIAGVVLADRVHASGHVVRLAEFGRIGIEFEIAMRLGRDLGPGDAPFDRAKVAAAVDAVAPAFELIDDRQADYKTLDVLSLVADNSWNEGVVLGAFRSTWPELGAIVGTVTCDGAEIDRGRGSDVLGHPLAPLEWLAGHLAQSGGALRAGDIVMTGSLVTTRFPEPGQRYGFALDGLGAVELSAV